jgi:hypothetical protein
MNPVTGFALVKIHRVSETFIMPISLDQIVEETREMPGEVVAGLVDRINTMRTSPSNSAGVFIARCT